jgi:two-component system response regulator FixJ
MNEQATVCVVDDDAPVRHLACQILKADGHNVLSFASAAEFFAAFDDNLVDCVVTDLRMPQVDGTQLLARLREIGSAVSVVVLTGHADVRTAVRMMEDGALTLVEKPYAPPELASAVRRAIERTQAQRSGRQAISGAQQGIARLTDDERKVMDYMVAGLPNKAIAMRLDLSLRTVDRRRSAVLTKMGVGSVGELAAMVARLQGEGSD